MITSGTTFYPQLAMTKHYNIYQAYIGNFAGQTGQLLFTSTFSPFALGDAIDNIQFVLAPEPPSWSLFCLGCGTLIYVRRIQTRSRP
jgi:hypothetical protein